MPGEAMGEPPGEAIGEAFGEMMGESVGGGARPAPHAQGMVSLESPFGA